MTKKPAKPASKTQKPICSFCGKSPQQVFYLVTSKKGRASICNECVQVASSIVFHAKFEKSLAHGSPNK